MLHALLLLAPDVFAEGFEDGTLSAWGDHRGEIRIVADDPFRGSRCAEFTARPGTGTGGHIVRWFMPGYDEIWVRWAVKFAPDFDQGKHMHLCWVAGNRADNKYSAFGKAGQRPTGSDFFVTNLEPSTERGAVEPPGTLMFYAYWPDMKRSPDGKYWGNNLLSNPKLQVPRGKWVQMAMWMKLNEPGKANGEQAFWLDGRLGGHFKDMRFRDTNALRLNSFALDLYVHESRKLNRVWFDEVEISTRPLPGLSLTGGSDSPVKNRQKKHWRTEL